MTEFDVRNSQTRAVLEMFRAKPGWWFHWRRFIRIAPCSWRTRISDARKVLERAGGSVEWNKRIRRSAYRYLPQRPLGRDAGEQVSQKSLF